jgi:hypothetical protein
VIFFRLERVSIGNLIRKACLPAIVFMVANIAAFVPDQANATEFGAYIGAGCDGVKRIGDFEQFAGRKLERTVDALNQTTATCHGVPYNAAQWPDPASIASGLRQLGYSLPDSGDFRQYFATPVGRRTVEAFQRKANEQGVSAVLGGLLRVDGILGPCTLRALTAMTERFFRKEWPGPAIA